MAMDKESPDKESSGAKGGMGAGGKSSGAGGSNSAGGGIGTGGGDSGPSARKSTASDFTSPNKSVDPNAAAARAAARSDLQESLRDSSGTDMDPQAAQKRAITGLLRQGIVPKLDDTGGIIGADPERPATIDSFGKYTPGTGAFAATGQYYDPSARMDAQGHLSQYGLIESELPSKWSKAGSLIGLGLGPGGSMLGGMAGTMADAAAAKSGLLDAGMNPDIAEKIAESTYGRKALGNLGGSLVGGPAAEFGYGLGGPEGAMAAASAAQAGVSAGAGALTGGEYNAADVAGLSTQTNKITKNDSGDGPWFERVAKQLESPSQAVAGQPAKESIAPAIPTRLNYLEDSLANSAMQYASNANYQPRAVYSSGASSGASGTYYGNAPSSGTVINI